MALLVGVVAAVSWLAALQTPRATTPDVPATSATDPAPDSRAVQSPKAEPQPTNSDSEPESERERSRNADLVREITDGPVSTGDFVAGYDRALFGQTWADVDRNGCDTRNDILRRDLTEVVIKQGTFGCKVLAGRLDDPYSGLTIAFVSGETTSIEVQIDHVVPLAWAWQNGASRWTVDQRTRFANDPANLLAVDGRLNQEKSASGPASWLPPDKSYHCEYMQSFATVVIDYRLSLPGDDRNALVSNLSNC